MSLTALSLMERDRNLFQDIEKNKKHVEFIAYAFPQKTITYGYTQTISELVNIAKAHTLGWDIAKRPTGGGIVFHFPEDLIFSLGLSFDHAGEMGINEAYLWFSKKIKDVCEKMGVILEEEGTGAFSTSDPIMPLSSLCFVHARDYELLYRGKKAVGIAQRRGRNGFLLQGAINLAP